VQDREGEKGVGRDCLPSVLFWLLCGWIWLDSSLSMQAAVDELHALGLQAAPTGDEEEPGPEEREGGGEPRGEGGGEKEEEEAAAIGTLSSYLFSPLRQQQQGGRQGLVVEDALVQALPEHLRARVAALQREHSQVRRRRSDLKLAKG
jgi:hypothetical protein